MPSVEPARRGLAALSEFYATYERFTRATLHADLLSRMVVGLRHRPRARAWRPRPAVRGGGRLRSRQRPHPPRLHVRRVTGHPRNRGQTLDGGRAGEGPPEAGSDLACVNQPVSRHDAFGAATGDRPFHPARPPWHTRAVKLERVDFGRPRPCRRRCGSPASCATTAGGDPRVAPKTYWYEFPASMPTTCQRPATRGSPACCRWPMASGRALELCRPVDGAACSTRAERLRTGSVEPGAPAGRAIDADVAARTLRPRDAHRQPFLRRHRLVLHRALSRTPRRSTT